MGRVVGWTCERRPVCGYRAHGGKRAACRRCRRPRALQKMEDAPIAGWYTIDGGQTPEDDIIEVKRERPPRLVWSMPPTWHCPSGPSACSTNVMWPASRCSPRIRSPLSILIEEIEQSLMISSSLGSSRATRSSTTPCRRKSLTSSTPCTTPWPPTTFPTLSAWGQSNRSACPC